MATTNQLTLAPSGDAPDIASGSILFIGNATVLIRYAGFTILTDPTFIHIHEQVSIGYGLHAMRLTNPAMEIEELPALDLVLLSHFHGDHFDQVAEQQLDKALPDRNHQRSRQGTSGTGFWEHSPARHLVISDHR